MNPSTEDKFLLRAPSELRTTVEGFRRWLASLGDPYPQLWRPALIERREYGPNPAVCQTVRGTPAFSFRPLPDLQFHCQSILLGLGGRPKGLEGSHERG